MLEVEGDKISTVASDCWQVLWVLFLYCFLFFFVAYELAANFMSGGVLSGVALLMGELYVVWSD
jgi:hypothetical protein